jgi:MFS family permease
MVRRPSLGAIFLTIFLDLLGFGLVLPFLAERARDTFGTSELTGTLLSAVYSLMQFLFVPVWGRLSDRVGRRPVLVWSVAATALSWVGLGAGLAWGTSVLWLFAARIAAGIATANLGTASAYIADVTPPEERARGMGLIGMAFGLGFILGPGLGGVLADIEVHGRHGPVACWAAAALSVVNLGWVVIGLAESLPPENRSKEPARRMPLDVVAAKQAFAIPGVARAVLVNFVLVLSFASFEQTYRFFNKDVFGMTVRETGLVLAFIGVVAAGVQGGLIRRLARRFHEGTLIRVGSALQIVAFLATAAAPWTGRWMLYVAGAVLALGNGITQPSVSAYVSKSAGADQQGGVLGTSQSAASLARMFGPALGGLLYQSLGRNAPNVAAAVGMAGGLLIALGLAAPRAQSTSTQTS